MFLKVEKIQTMCPASHSGEPGIQSEATHSALSPGLLSGTTDPCHIVSEVVLY